MRMPQMPQTPAKLDADRLFRAFADRTRLRILGMLKRGELCVGDIVEILRAPQARVSRHLAYLRRSGLVAVRQDGRWSFYSLARPADGFHRKLLQCLQACFRDVPEIVADFRRQQRVSRGGGCCPRSRPRMRRG